MGKVLVGFVFGPVSVSRRSTAMVDMRCSLDSSLLKDEVGKGLHKKS